MAPIRIAFKKKVNNVIRIYWKNSRIYLKMCGDGGKMEDTTSTMVRSVTWLNLCSCWKNVNCPLLKFLFGCCCFCFVWFGCFFCFFLPKKALEGGLNYSHFISSRTEMCGVYAVLIWSNTRLSSLVSYFCYSVVQHLFWILKMVLSPYNQFFKIELWRGCLCYPSADLSHGFFKEKW